MVSETSYHAIKTECAHLREDNRRLRADNEQLEREVQRLRRTLYRDVSQADPRLRASRELTAGTSLGPRRRPS